MLSHRAASLNQRRKRKRNGCKQKQVFFFLLLCEPKVHRAEFTIFLCGDGRRRRRGSAWEQNMEPPAGSGPEVAQAY